MGKFLFSGIFVSSEQFFRNHPVIKNLLSPGVFQVVPALLKNNFSFSGHIQRNLIDLPISAYLRGQAVMDGCERGVGGSF